MLGLGFGVQGLDASRAVGCGNRVGDLGFGNKAIRAC